MSKQSIDDLTFVMSCLKHSGGKPNFEAVGQELGMAKATAYQRHWQLCKKWGLTGTRAAGADPATPKTPAKRARSTKATPVANTEMNNDDDGDEEQFDTPTKKVKRTKRITAYPLPLQTGTEPGAETAKGKE